MFINTILGFFLANLKKYGSDCLQVWILKKEDGEKRKDGNGTNEMRKTVCSSTSCQMYELSSNERKYKAKRLCKIQTVVVTYLTPTCKKSCNNNFLSIPMYTISEIFK